MIQNNVDHITRDRNIGFKILSEPEGSISTAPINLLHLVDFGLRQLVNNTKKLGYSKINLLSYIILSLQHLHSTVCKKYDTQTLETCAQYFPFFMKESVKQLVERVAYYFNIKRNLVFSPSKQNELEDVKFPK